MKQIILSLFLLVISVPTAVAEIKTFNVIVEESVGKSQSQEAIEAFALQKAKRLAVEKAGTYFSSLSIVKKGILGKDEITAIASGIVTADILYNNIYVKNGQLFVKISADVAVDTSILYEQIKSLMHDKELLLKLNKERKHALELEEKLKTVKKAELDRLEKLNRQAIALEMDREKQRLFREEQRLNAMGAIAKADKQRLKEEQERLERFRTLLKKQEIDQKKEMKAIVREKNRIRKAQLENERLANELARRAEVNREKWIPINDKLSLHEAIVEANKIEYEIASLRQNIKIQNTLAIENLQNAYDQQIAATKAYLPPKPTEKDLFETTQEYSLRISKYEESVTQAKEKNKRTIADLKIEKRIHLCSLRVDALTREIEVLHPFVDQLEAIQSKAFLMPSVKCSISLAPPDADNSRFPIAIQCGKKEWKTYWKYSDRKNAKIFWQTRAHLVADPLYVVTEGKNGANQLLAGARISHLGTNESKDFIFNSPSSTSKTYLSRLKNEDLPTAKKNLKNAPYLEGFTEPRTEMNFVWVQGGCYNMGSNRGESDEKPIHEICVDSFLIGKYEVTQFEWTKLMGKNPSHFKNGDRYPVENVSWEDINSYLLKLNGIGDGNFRLPTEAEWEFAARSGGKSEEYSGGNTVGDVAWYNGNSGERTHPVGLKNPNGLGIHDMSGNVWEWCQDRYGEYSYSQSPQYNPVGVQNGFKHVLRGGSWGYGPTEMRSTNRFSSTPGNRSNRIGFRLVLSH